MNGSHIFRIIVCVSMLLQSTLVFCDSLDPSSQVALVVEKLCDIEEDVTPICEKFEETWTILAALPSPLFVYQLSATCQTSIAVDMPITITQPGSYCLVEDIAGTVTIAADQVFFDLNEHCISGGANGIEVSGQEEVLIYNGIIKNQSNAGILITTGNSIRIEEITFKENNDGIFAQTSTCIQIERCVFDSQVDVAITYSNINSSQIIQNKIQASGAEGIILVNGSNNNGILNNTVLQSSADGIELNASTENSIQYNRVCNASGNGILLSSAANNNILLGNEAYGNGFSGIRVAGSFDNAIKSNICNTNTGGAFAGITLAETSSRNQVLGNICNSNTGRGIFLDASGTNLDGNIINDNNCNFNSMSGIEVQSSNNILLRNTTDQNIINGILNSGTNNKVFNSSAFKNVAANFVGVQAEVQGMEPRNCRYICASDLPFTITEPGSYCLIEDGDNTITIDADNVVLNLGGHVLRNTAFISNAVVVSGHSDIKISDGGIENFNGQAGVEIDQCFNLLVEHINFKENGVSGISVVTSTCIRVENCVFEDEQVSINLVDSYGSLLRYNKIQRYIGIGIVLQNSSLNVIEGNRTEGIPLSTSGFEIISSNNNIIRNNLSVASDQDGMFISASKNNFIVNNTIRQSTDSGISVINNSTEQLLRNNVCTNNGNNGLQVADTASNNYLINNVCINNGNNGVEISSDNNLLSGNQSHFNGANGIRLAAGGDDNILLFNKAQSNTTNGILNSGSGNKLFNNIAIENTTADFSGVAFEVQGIQPTNCRYICAADLNGTFTISESGTYCLIEDATGGIRVNADNVTLDLRDQVLTGNVQVEKITPGTIESVVVKNGTIQNSSGAGVSADIAIGLELFELNLRGSGSAQGVFVSSTTGLFITDCSVQGYSAGDGISLSSVNNGIVSDCKLTNNFTAAEIIGSSEQCIIQNCFITSNTKGIAVDASPFGIIRNNVCMNNTSTAIVLTGASPNTVIEQNICMHNKTGIAISDKGNSGCTVTENICSDNGFGLSGGFGFAFEQTDSHVITDNIATHNSQDGIIVRMVGAVTSDDNFVGSNVANFNGEDGISTLSASNSATSDVVNNIALINTFTDYSVPASLSSLIKGALESPTQGSNLRS